MPNGRRIEFYDYRYPSRGKPPCTDPEIIAFLDGKLGRKITVETDPDSILVDPQAVPPDCEKAHLEKALKNLIRQGYNVNPKFLKTDEDEPERPQLPARTFIRSAKKSELQEVIDKFGWDIDKDQKVPELKDAILATIEELSD
jgi:hypothetical protein